MKNLLRRIGGFALLPAMSMLASLVLVPLIAVNDGSAGWSALSLGQSVGALVSVVGGLAWSIVGTQRIVHARDETARRRVFALSWITRGLVILVLCLISSPIIWVLAPSSQKLPTIVFSVATSLNGLTAAWYYTGTGNPRRLVINEGMTRAAGYLVAIPAVALTGALSSYAYCTLAAGVLAVALNYRSVFGSSGMPRVSAVEILDTFKSQAYGTSSQVARSLHLYTPTALLSAFVPIAVPLFTAINIVYKAGLNSVAFLPPALVQWMQPGGRVSSRRKRASLMICISAAICISVIWPFVGERIMRYLYQGRLDGGEGWIALIGLGVGISLVSFALQYLDAIPKGQDMTVFRVESVTSVLGVLAVVPMAMWFGGGGAFATYVLASLLKTVLLLVRRRPGQGLGKVD